MDGALVLNVDVNAARDFVLVVVVASTQGILIANTDSESHSKRNEASNGAITMIDSGTLLLCQPATY